MFRVDGSNADALHGRVCWHVSKSLWISLHIAICLVFALPMATPGAIGVFLLLTWLTLLFGHSVGMHRRLIHRTFVCKPWLDGVLIYFGVLVGMAGPFGIIRVHDMRDWAQRLPECHDFFSHRRPLWMDAFWQLHCRFEFNRPPEFHIERQTLNNRWLQLLERTWMLQQLPLATALYLLGGWPWVVWGISARIVVSVVGHWTITYLTHNPGPGNWFVPHAGVQASDRPGLGWLTMGECWHNNHHAFPESARIGFSGQTDPGWWVIRRLQRIGCVSEVRLPRPETEREDIVRITKATLLQKRASDNPVDVTNCDR